MFDSPEQPTTSRRGFLKKVALAAAGVVTAGALGRTVASGALDAPTSATGENLESEKKSLPEKQPFEGNLCDINRNPIGRIVVSSITKDNVFVYFIAGDQKNGYDATTFMAQTKSTEEDGTFLAIDDSGVWRIQANLDKTGKVLSGEVGRGRPGGPTTLTSNFPALNLTSASGKEAILGSVREAKAGVTGMPPAQVKIDEIAGISNNWPE